MTVRTARRGTIFRDGFAPGCMRYASLDRGPDPITQERLEFAALP